MGSKKKETALQVSLKEELPSSTWLGLGGKEDGVGREVEYKNDIVCQ